MRSRAAGAIGAQGAQALASFVLQVAVARILGVEALGVFAILYGVVVLASGTITGFVGDSIVVLDRRDRVVRSALEQYTVLFAVGTGLIAAACTTLAGLTGPLEGMLLAVAVAAFCAEEIVRRALMAELHFWRVAAIDSLGLVAALLVLAGTAALAPLSLVTFLAALAVGQTVALMAGVRALPAAERYLVPVLPGGRRRVAAYGTWRSLQQFLRPALLTSVRSAVGVAAGLTATGLLESARVYVAPALLLVGGLSSYLFSTFARQRDRPLALRVRTADRAVAALLGVTVIVGAVAVAALPLVGAALFARPPDLRAVLGWLAYSASIAAVTPYGALAAVSGGQARVFAIRAIDTVLSLATVLAGLALGVDPAWAAALLTAGSLAGGITIRLVVLPHTRPAAAEVAEPAVA